MIVKILRAAVNFEGIDYSERKNDKGTSELLASGNFEGLGIGLSEVRKSDYRRYMEFVSSLNNNVKKKQFHAVISTKSTLHTYEELKLIAEKYLKEMGYAKNPYLIYAHYDTDNNHVHIVSTRVDKEGKKINDSFEKLRSQKAIQKILKQDPKQQAVEAVNESIKYNFSTLSQFKLLLEQQGYVVREKGDTLEIIKYGNIQHNLKIASFLSKIEQYEPPSSRIKQLQFIFQKYKAGLDTSEFIAFMESKFGIQVILHTAKGHDKSYGYSIIDHAKKEMLKGSQVMKLAQLLDNSNPNEKINQVEEYIKNIDYSNHASTFSAVRKELAAMGIKLDNKGNITVKGLKKSIQIPENWLSNLKYNDRLELAKSYKFYTEQGKMALARSFFINEKDLVQQVIPENTQSMEYYHTILHNISQTQNPSESMELHNLQLIRSGNTFFILDSEAREFIAIDPQLLGMKIDLNDYEYISLDDSNKNSLTEDMLSTQAPISDLSVVLGILASADFYEQPEQQKRKRQSL